MRKMYFKPELKVVYFKPCAMLQASFDTNNEKGGSWNADAKSDNGGSDNSGVDIEW